jgi:uncharacterized protein YjbI with pentapeptide repeats
VFQTRFVAFDTARYPCHDRFAIEVPAPPFAASVVYLILIVIGIPLSLFVASVFFLTREETLWRFKRADLKAIGSSLLTGSIVSLAIFALQFYLAREDASRAKEEQFRLTIGLSKDLEGLDPPLSLAGLNLPDKNLDQAELAGEDLTDTNLAGSSLRNANLRRANLEGANLFRADLRGALLTGADLDDATLASANLRDATIFGPSGVKLELDGTKVDARTCWPADFLTSAAAHRLRNQLDPQPIVQTGRTLKSQAKGFACELTFDNVLQDLQQPRAPRTLAEVAGPYALRAETFLDRARPDEGELPAEKRPLELRDPLCAGSRRVLARRSGWQDATALLMIRLPAQQLDETHTMLVAQAPPDSERKEGDVLLEPGERLTRPVVGGSGVRLFGAASPKFGIVPDYTTGARVSGC